MVNGLTSMIFDLLNKIRNPHDQDIEVESVQEKQSVEKQQILCSNCEVLLNITENLRYCPYCGSSIE